MIEVITNTCHHSYSKAMGQPYPRRCVHCGEPEFNWSTLFYRYGKEVEAHNQSLENFQVWLENNYVLPLMR